MKNLLLSAFRTTSERILISMANVIFILGAIATIAIFLTSCIAWEISDYSGDIRGIDGINWFGIPLLIYCIMGTLISWSVLAILAEISIYIRDRSDGNQSIWEKDFALMISTKQIDKAKEILYRTILESDEFKLVLSGGNETYHQECIDRLHHKYGKYLKYIGEDRFMYDKENELVKVFKSHN